MQETKHTQVIGSCEQIIDKQKLEPDILVHQICKAVQDWLKHSTTQSTD